MTTSSLLHPPAAGTPWSAPAPTTEPMLAAPPARVVVDGLTWECRPGCESVLSEMDRAAWSRPEALGWQSIKRNARREVWRAVIRDSTYYIKYYHSGWWRRTLGQWLGNDACQAEWAGGLFAMRAGIPAVRPVARAAGVPRPGGRCDVLITEAVEPAQPLDAFWLQLQSDTDYRRRREDARELVERLAHTIARAHQAGFEHLDMHAANILVQPIAPRRYRTLLVDLHSARRGVPISDRAVVRNLAQLNQWFHKHSTIGDRIRFIRAYYRWRHEYEHAFAYARPLGLDFGQLVRALAVAARRHAQRLGVQRDHRAWRDGRYFTRVSLPGGWRGLAMVSSKRASEDSRASRMTMDRQWWSAELTKALRSLDPEDGRLCKNSHSAQVSRALLDHPDGKLPVIVKRPLARTAWRRLRQCLRSSRSARGWRMGYSLLHRDVPTARPLAVLEKRAGPLVLDSVLITEAIPGAMDLESFLRQEHTRCQPRQWCLLKRELSDRLAAFVRRLQERGFHHRDCKASNILITPVPRRTLLWIDLDGIRYTGRLSPQQQLRPLLRLHVSLLDVPGLTRGDRVRFLKAYLSRFGTDPGDWRTIWRLLVPGVQDKVRTLAARRAWKHRHYGRE